MNMNGYTIMSANDNLNKIKAENTLDTLALEFGKKYRCVLHTLVVKSLKEGCQYCTGILKYIEKIIFWVDVFVFKMTKDL